MPTTDDVVNELVKFLKDELKVSNVSVEKYGDERMVIIDLTDDFSIYVSLVCNNECDVDYALGDENFTIRPERLDILKGSFDILLRINDYLIKHGIIKANQ